MTPLVTDRRAYEWLAGGLVETGAPVLVPGVIGALPTWPAGRKSGVCITLRLLTTVEIACLKINCSWLLFSSSTEYLSKERILPVNLTPLTRS